LRLLLRIESSEHEIHLPSLLELVPHTYAHTGKGGRLQEELDVLEPVVAAVAPRSPHPESPEGEVEVVANDHNSLDGHILLLHPIADGIAAEVHKGGGLDEVKFPPLEPEECMIPVTSRRENDIGCLSPSIQYHKTYVVPRLCIFAPHVSKAEYEVRLLGHFVLN